MKELLETLREQRWDDHRYYHHSRINQSLHFISALSFLWAYILLFTDPASAALVAWFISMTSRQAGHFFFEPRGYDVINHATHEHKEAIKVGYNLRRKVILMSIWALAPVVMLADPSLNGLLPLATSPGEFLHNVGMVWFAVGAGGLLYRTIQLCIVQGSRTGLAWMIKILTDPFHDAGLYYKAPFHLLRGELVDPNHARHRA